MALPKRKISKARRDKRRTHYKLSPPTYTTCPQCQEAKLPHAVCLNCGHYNGQKIIEVKEKI
ncbi:MAG: 50S ribosomal protein L32 [bacterium]